MGRTTPLIHHEDAKQFSVLESHSVVGPFVCSGFGFAIAGPRLPSEVM
jgi:hypothetical protein